MSDLIEQALEGARRERTAGRPKQAELAYARAAELARSAGNDQRLAHALRHLSDLARERGARGESYEHASQAVALYRKGHDQLGLANAVRLQALAAADPDEARACWQEARELYAALGVGAGIEECDRRLA